MKNIILIMTTLLSLSASATEIYVRNGESLTIVNRDCKSSEYTSVVTTNLPQNGLTTTCLPKICETRRYLNIRNGWHMEVSLLPDYKVILDTNNIQEGLDTVNEFIADGVCAKRQKYVPSM